MAQPTGAPYLDAPGRHGVLAFAHRGGAEHPDLVGRENTLTAFRHAVDLGYRYLETDVHTTRDGVLVACHDADLARVAGHDAQVADLTWDDVRAIPVGGEPVPRFADLWDALPAARFNVDLKSEGAVCALAAFVHARRAERPADRLLVASFSRRRLRAFRRLVADLPDGPVPTSAHPLEGAAYLLLPSGRLARRLAGAPLALQVPHRQRVGPVTITVASAGLVRRAHAAGVQVHVWTIDDADEIATLLRRGVDGVMTDRTDVLKDVLQRSGLWGETPG